MGKLAKRVLELFHESSLTVKEVSKALSVSYDSAKQCLHRLNNSGEIERLCRGTYCSKDDSDKIRFLPCHRKVSKDFTFIIPQRIISKRNVKPGPIKITLRKEEQKDTFITKAYYRQKLHQIGIFIPEDVRKNLCLKPLDSINLVDIQKIKPFIPFSRMFFGNKIDLTFFIPKKTKKEFKIFVEEIKKNGESILILKYVTPNGSSKQVSIKRFVDLVEFGSVLGILQAEGTKFENLPANQSPRLIFTNKPIEEHRQFIAALENMGVEKSLIKAEVYCNPLKVSESKLKDCINKFTKATGIKPIIYSYSNQKKLYYCFQTKVERAVLAELFLNALDKTRRVITKQNRLEGSLKKFAEAFLAKLLTGDGSISFTRNSRGYFVVQGYISDKNRSYRQDYRKLLKLLGISAANWDDGQRVYFKCSKESLRFLIQIGAFKGTGNWRKLLQGIILKQEISGNYLRFKEIERQRGITHKAFADLFGVKIAAAKNWLRDKRKKGYFLLANSESKEYKYILSRSAQGFLYFSDFYRSELEREKNAVKESNKTFRAPTLQNRWKSQRSEDLSMVQKSIEK